MHSKITDHFPILLDIKLWSVTNFIINRSKSVNISELFDEQGSLVNTNEGIANVFNNFFIHAAENVLHENISLNISTNYNHESIAVPFNFYLEPTDPIETKNCLLSLRSNKAPGIDGLDGNTLKLTADSICQPLSDLINRIFVTGCCPKVFKTAVVVPIYKSRQKTLATNYRPISLISNLAKVFEKLLHRRICKFLNNHNLLSDNQFGFREGVGTGNALQSIIGKIYQHLNNNRANLCIF